MYQAVNPLFWLACAPGNIEIIDDNLDWLIIMEKKDTRAVMAILQKGGKVAWHRMFIVSQQNAAFLCCKGQQGNIFKT